MRASDLGPSENQASESLGELEKAAETIACDSCSHSISHSPKLPPAVFLKKRERCSPLVEHGRCTISAEYLSCHSFVAVVVVCFCLFVGFLSLLLLSSVSFYFPFFWKNLRERQEEPGDDLGTRM